MLPGRPDPFLADDDNPEIPDEQMARMRPASEVLDPALYARLIRAQPAGETVAAAPIVLTLAPDLAAGLRATGPEWQERAQAILRAAIGIPQVE